MSVGAWASRALRIKTARAGSATSVLDLDCKAHDVDNLYVADAGFFVSSTAVNPTLTIIANALRVADRIAERLGSRRSDTLAVSQSR